MGPAAADVISGAVSVELVHLGSLYHDDVMDDATTRRTVESVNARWGNLKAILAGDYLLARASEIAASLGTEVAGLLAATIARLCEGQVLELQHTFDVTRTEEAYLRLDRRQDGLPAGHRLSHRRHRGRAAPAGRSSSSPTSATATAWPSRSSTTSSTSSPPTSSSASPSGHDLVEGVYTLPVLRVLSAGGPDADRLGELLGRPLDGADLDDARSIVRSSGQVDAALASARDFAHQAAGALAEVADTEAGHRAGRRLGPPARVRPGRRRPLSNLSGSRLARSPHPTGTGGDRCTQRFPDRYQFELSGSQQRPGVRSGAEQHHRTAPDGRSPPAASSRAQACVAERSSTTELRQMGEARPQRACERGHRELTQV